MIKTNNLTQTALLCFILSMLFLPVANAGLVDTISVMYKGEIVESGSVNKIIDNPSHPYTKKLINSIPVDKLSSYNEKKDIVLSIKKLNKVYSGRKDLITKFYTLFNKNKKNDENIAIKNLSLDIFNGEILGVVGESGCGKSTLGKIICEILDKNSGEIFYQNKKLSNSRKSNLDIQMVFQDPYSSLNPRKKVVDIIGEAAHVHKIVNKRDIKKYVSDLMTSCELSPSLMNRYPHEFSGGQRQRIAIARALAVKPSLLICDEIVSALDVSIQAQILELINKLNKQNKLTIIFISHDLSVVNYISDRVAVMHLGEIVELDRSDKVFLKPSHSYTRALLANLPTIKDRSINYKPTLYTEE